jgi:hypothetical protein
LQREASDVDDVENNDDDEAGKEDSLKSEQQQDVVIGPVVLALTEGRPKLTHDDESGGLPADCHTMFRKASELCFVDGVLHRIREGKRPVLVLPRCRQRHLVTQLHEIGHMGIKKTLAAAKERYYWPRMAQTVELMVKNCTVCQKAKPSSLGRAPLQPIATGFPMQRIGIDIVKMPTSHQGRNKVLTIIDYFTKWVELVPLEDERADTIARSLFREWIARFGAPHILHSDRGQNVDGKIVRSLCEVFDIQKTRTTAFRPQCDGLVERFHRTLHSMLRCLLQSTEPENWEDVLPHCLLAYRSSVSSSTTLTPHFLLTGREVTLPLDIVYRLPHPRFSAPSYAAEVVEQQIKAYEVVRRALRTAHRRQKKFYDKRAKRRRTFRKGALVWMYQPPTVTQQRDPRWSAKHVAPWTGPHQVLKKVSPVNYLIKELSGRRRTRVVHIDKIKLVTASKQRHPDEMESEADVDDDRVVV